MNWRQTIVALLVASPAWADVITLNDDSKLEGTLKRDGNEWVLTDARGKQVRLSDSVVKSIQKTSNLSASQQAAGALASLRRVVDGVGDPAAAIDRYNKFIEQHKSHPTVVEDARKDLEVWKERHSKQMVKVGTQWMTSEEYAALFEKSVALIDQARNQIKEGRLRDAEQIVNQLLAADPEHASALYLRALLAHKQGEIGVAKKYFEKVRESVSDHGPTFNNLAAVLWQQKQYASALPLYDLAMQHSPLNRQILDNVAEALAGLPNDLRESAAGKRVAKRFIEQDTQLQQKLSQEGLFRWGATFVNKTQKAEIDKAQEKIDAKIKLLEEDFKKVQERIKSIDDQMDVNEKTMQRINRDRTYQDGSGRVIQLRPPSVYYELKRDNDKLKKEREDLVGKVDEFNDRARKIQQETPIPKYTGLQKIIETEGTPLVAPRKQEPATRPAAPPARSVQ